MIPSDSAQFDSDKNLDLWRNEVRQFCEETILELKKVTATLQADRTSQLASLATEKEVVKQPQRSDSTALPMTSNESSGVSWNDDEADSSGSRLENLKRQLSEKLRQSDSNPQIVQ